MCALGLAVIAAGTAGMGVYSSPVVVKEKTTNSANDSGGFSSPFLSPFSREGTQRSETLDLQAVLTSPWSPAKAMRYASTPQRVRTARLRHRLVEKRRRGRRGIRGGGGSGGGGGRESGVCGVVNIVAQRRDRDRDRDRGHRGEGNLNLHRQLREPLFDRGCHAADYDYGTLQSRTRPNPNPNPII